MPHAEVCVVIDTHLWDVECRSVVWPLESEQTCVQLLARRLIDQVASAV